jgi:hypothetical protein
MDKHPKRNGRPLFPRETVGYDKDLGNLARLRSACLADSRLTTEQYMRIAEAIQTIEKTIRRLPKD